MTRGKAKKRYKPLSDDEMAKLATPPRWWLEQHQPIAITGYRTPAGDAIKASCEYDGVRYEGVLHPVRQ